MFKTFKSPHGLFVALRNYSVTGPPSDDDKLGQRYAVAVRRMQSLQRDLRHSEARLAELEDQNSLLRRQMTETEARAEETAGHLTDQVHQLTTQLEQADIHLQQIKVLTEFLIL